MEVYTLYTFKHTTHGHDCTSNYINHDSMKTCKEHQQYLYTIKYITLKVL